MSRPGLISTSPPVRLCTSTLVTDGHSECSSALSTAAFSRIDLRARTPSSAVSTTLQPASTMRARNACSEKGRATVKLTCGKCIGCRSVCIRARSGRRGQARSTCNSSCPKATRKGRSGAIASGNMAVDTAPLLRTRRTRPSERLRCERRPTSQRRLLGPSACIGTRGRLCARPGCEAHWRSGR
eukprot:scaffold17620_cov155-Isochrysis_galbana.AAC.4